MALSLRAAFAAVEGRSLDLAIGAVIPPREHAPVDEAVRRAFAGFDGREYREIVGKLQRRSRRQEADAWDAVNAALLRLLERQPQLFREDPRNWLGRLYQWAWFELIGEDPRRARATSPERLIELGAESDRAEVGRLAPLSPLQVGVGGGIPMPSPGEEWTEGQVVDALRRFYARHGRPPKAVECRRLNGLPSTATIHRLFGSFNDAILAAGMIPPTLGQRRTRWTPLEAAEACYSFRRRNGRWPDLRDAKLNPGELPGYEAMTRYFGGTRSGQVQRGAELILRSAGRL